MTSETRKVAAEEDFGSQAPLTFIYIEVASYLLLSPSSHVKEFALRQAITHYMFDRMFRTVQVRVKCMS